MEIGLRVFGFFLKLASILTWPIFYVISLKSHKKLPPLTNNVLRQSATSLARRIRLGELRSEDVVKAFKARIEQVNPHLNAVVEERFAAALDDAKAVDLLVASRRKTPKQLATETPFLGVPFTVKESCGVKGLSFTVGSRSRIGMKAPSDGDAVSNMRASGAIPIAVTNTPELCLSWETHNLVSGRSNNPYDQSRTCGGSSGGEAALVGAGASVFGIGSDIAGSIRIPALYNGIFGHKPTQGVVPITGHYPHLMDPNFHKFMAVGPMCRYAEDLKPMLTAMAGNQAPILRLDDEVDLKKLKIFYMEDADGGNSVVSVQVDNEIKEVLQKAVTLFSSKHGSLTQKAEIIEMEVALEISSPVFFGLEDIPNLLSNSKNPKVNFNLYLEMLKSIFGLSDISFYTLCFYLLKHTNAFIPKHKYSKYWNQNQALRKKFIDLLKNDGVFFFPTHPVPAMFHTQSLLKTAGVLYAMIFNTLGLPATHVPLGLNNEGLPIGIQVVAAPNEDRLCIAVAEELGKHFGGWVEPQSAKLNKNIKSKTYPQTR